MSSIICYYMLYICFSSNIYIFLFHLSLFVWCNANIKKLIMKHKEDSKCYKKIDYYYYYFIPYLHPFLCSSNILKS